MPQSAPQPDPQQYLQSLMQAGQEVVQQFERALSGGAMIAPSGLKWLAATPTSIADLFDLQRRYFEQMGQLWSSFLPGLSSEERKPVAAPAKGDNRFRDEAWQKEPYYGAVKQSYLIGAKFLHDFVEQADVDDKAKLQLRFYARQFTDAISPSNFPMTNPEVIRTAIGVPVDLSAIKAPVYLLAAREDHIVPWKRPILPSACWTAVGNSGSAPAAILPAWAIRLSR